MWKKTPGEAWKQSIPTEIWPAACDKSRAGFARVFGPAAWLFLLAPCPLEYDSSRLDVALSGGQKPHRPAERDFCRRLRPG